MNFASCAHKCKHTSSAKETQTQKSTHKASMSDSDYYVVWLQVESDLLADDERDGEILVQLKDKISCPHTENLCNQVDRILFFFWVW